MFCIYFHFEPIPATVKNLTLYAQFLSRSFKTVDDIRNYISGVKLLHLYLDIDYQQFESLQLKLVLKGLARLNPHCSKQARPITPTIFCYILTKLDLNNSCDATFWCLSLHAFFLMLGKSNLVPNSVSSFNPEKQLSRNYIDYDKERNILLITIKWSKTIKFGERHLIIPIVAIPGSSLCPVKVYLNMVKLVPAVNNEPAYSIFKHKKVIPVTYRQFQTILKKLIKLIGENPETFSTHGFRRGGASWC